MTPFAALKNDTSTSALKNLPDNGPNTARIASAATWSLAAAAFVPSAATYPRLAMVYRKISAPVATAIARGKTRWGSRVSPAENVTYCHPSYAQRIPIIAPPRPAKRDVGAAMGGADVSAAP